MSQVLLALLACTRICVAQGLGLSYAPLAGNGQAQLIRSANAAGDVFVVSTSVNPSGRGVITAAKLDSSGQVLAATNFGSGGLAYDSATGAAVDSAGDLVVVGTSESQSAVFVIKLDPTLANTIFAKYLGGTRTYIAGGGVALDGAGNIYVSGSTTSSDFPVTDGAYQTRPPKGDGFGTPSYAFVTKLSPDGSHILASTYFGADAATCIGGSGCIGVFAGTIANSVVADSSGKIWIAGSTTAHDLPTTAGVYASDCACDRWRSAGFVAAFDSNLANLLESSFVPFGDLASPYARLAVSSLAVTPSGDPLFAGLAEAGFPTTPGTVQPAFPPVSSPAGFIVELDNALHSLVFGTYFGGGPYNSGVSAVEMTQDGSFWITGRADSTTIPGAGSPGFGPTYVARLAPDASHLLALQTAPIDAAGQALALSPAGTPKALGASGSVLTLPSQSGSPVLLGVANAAAPFVSGRLAPLEVVSLYGIAIGPAQASGPVWIGGDPSTVLNGYQVLFDGTAAQLLYAGPNQFNAIVPDSVYAHDMVRLSIQSLTGTMQGPLMAVVSAAPQVFAGLTNQDGTVNSTSNPADTGSIVSIWLTGCAPEGISVLRGESQSSLEVTYAGDAPGLVKGIQQVNFRLPEAFSPSANTARIFIVQSGGASSTPFTVYVKN